MNDGTENDNKIPTLSKVNDLIATASIDLSDYDQLVKITNENNELTAKQITLNGKLITNTAATNLEVSENDNTILATKKYVDDHQPDLSTCVKNNIDQTLINKFVFNNNSNEFTGSSLTTNNLTINNKSINDIEKANDSSVNDNKLASLAKVIDLIESGSIDLSDYSGLVKITNTDNELTAKNIILNNNEIDNIIKKNNDETSNNKSIPTYSKVEELINNIDYTDFVRKTNKQELSNEFDFTNSNNKFKGNEIILDSKSITGIEITNDSSDQNNNKLASLAKIIDILTNYIKKENQTLNYQFYFDNVNNKFKGNEIILNSKSVSDIETSSSVLINNDKIPSLGKVNELINSIDYSNYVNKTDNQELINQFNFNNNNNKFKGNELIINNKSISDIEITNNSLDSNNNKLASLAKINSILSSALEEYIKKENQTLTYQFNFDNINNKFKGNEIILNSKSINDIELTTDTSKPNNDKIPTLAKVNELINNIDYSNYVNKTDNQELTNQFYFNNNNNKFKGNEIILNSKSINDVVITNNPSDTDNDKLASLSKINSIFTTTLTDYIKKENQTLTNQFYFDNINNKFKGNELILDSKSITSIETTNDSSDINNNKLASLAKINNILTDYVNKTDNQELTNQFYFNNTNNKFKGQQFILNNNEINNIITTGNSEINDDKIYSQSKIDEINEDFVSKTTNNIQTVNGQLNLPNKNNEIKMFKMYLPILN